MRLSSIRFCITFASFSAALLLAGCGMTPGSVVSSPASPAVQGAAINGSAFGGQQPINGAHVYLMAAGTSGYAGSSTSLLTSALTGHSDAVGAYVLTDANGNFSITGDYTCTANTQVYLYALGGNPGAGVNSGAGLMAVLGNCPSTGTLAAQTPIVLVNEVSTIAAAYAFAGYAVDAVHVSSSGTTLAQTGIANAFANAAQMYNIASSNQALAVTPNGNGTVPRALIHTLANILAACINSAGPTSSACTTLFNNAKNGSTPPTDTATAAINMAHSPAANVAALFALDSSTAPFQPHLSLQPNDFSITLTFSNSGFSTPSGLAVDASGNLQVANYGNASISKISPKGVVSTVFSNSILAGAFGIAIDPSGNSWTTASSGPYMFEVFASGGATYVNGYPATNKTLPGIDSLGEFFTGAGSGSSNYLYFEIAGSSYPNLAVGTLVTNPYATAIDTNNYSWTTSTGGSSGAVNLLKLKDISGNYSYATCTGTNYASGSGVAIDRNNNAWVSDSTTGYLVEFTNACAYSASYKPAGASSLLGIAIDGNNNVWSLTSGNSIAGISNAGTALSGASGFATGATGTQLGPVIDGSGNIWFSNSTSNTVSEMIGVAAPLITPLSAGVAAGTLGTRP